MRQAALTLSALSLPLSGAAQAGEATARAFWDALLGCWAVKDGAAPVDQGWVLRRDWTAYCATCDGGAQVWDAGEMEIVRERTAPDDDLSCALSEASRPRVEDVLPELDVIWAEAGVSWISSDLRRSDAPFALLLSCEPDVAMRKVAVVDASGGILKFSVTGSTPDADAQCAGAAG